MKMESGLATKFALLMGIGAIVLGTAGRSYGELQIVEIMFNPSNDDTIYEWIEVRNTGGTDIDLDGAWMDDIDPNTQAIPLTGNPSVGANASNSIVPAGGVAVIYDAFLGAGSSANFNDQLFRDSWGLGPEVKLIGADFFPSLNNTSPSGPPNNYVDNIGIWADPDLNTAINENYELDVDRGPTNPPPPENDDDDRVVSAANALVHQYYRTSGDSWPNAGAGVSIQWNGVGDRNDGANWYASVSGQNGATTNAPINITAGLNNTGDVANPGQVPAGTPPAGLIFTEILYDPQSLEVSGNNWEWAEVLNNTGQAIDFSATPYWYGNASFDLPQTSGVTAPNVTSGVIPAGGVAILFNSDGLTASQMQEAWGAFNFIPVTNAPALSNSEPNNTTIGLWDDETEYETDTAPDSPNPNLFTNAVAVLDYNETGAWPSTNGGAGESIYLSNLSLDPTVGGNWILASTTDGLSYGPNQVSGSQNIHPGGDVGSPGNFVIVPPDDLDGDYNEDGTVDAADYVVWRKNPGDFGGPGGYDTWRENFGETSAGSGGAVPEPATIGMLLVGVAALAFRRRAA
jgi:hypothetical protein